jgi:nitroreductase
MTLHPLLAGRRSPRAYDPAAVLSDDQIRRLLEAARWAPSAANSQPWRFILGRRGDAVFQRIYDTLAPGNRRWADRAGALLVGLAEVARADGQPNPYAGYDLGQALAHLSVQAEHEGLVVHQMGGFAADKVRVELGVPEGTDPFVVAAIGHAADPASLPDDLRERETAPRSRRPLTELVHGEDWARPHDLVA